MIFVLDEPSLVPFHILHLHMPQVVVFLLHFIVMENKNYLDSFILIIRKSTISSREGIYALIQLLCNECVIRTCNAHSGSFYKNLTWYIANALRACHVFMVSWHMSQISAYLPWRQIVNLWVRFFILTTDYLNFCSYLKTQFKQPLFISAADRVSI